MGAQRIAAQALLAQVASLGAAPPAGMAVVRPPAERRGLHVRE
jgi:hypothetical protein